MYYKMLGTKVPFLGDGVCLDAASVIVAFARHKSNRSPQSTHSTAGKVPTMVGGR